MISAVIPTFRGRSRLERNLGSVLASLSRSGEPFEVVVVDDGGGGIADLSSGARLLSLEENRGYGPAVNAGARDARGELLLVLNDDVRLEDDTVTVLRSRLPAQAVFAVVPKIRSPLAACGDEGGKAVEWLAGAAEIREAPSAVEQPTLYPVGCCFLCRRDIFLAMGGFDEIYAPFFWEDVDLGYRAWRRGLATRHVPEALCHHEGSATLRAERTLEERERHWFRNRVLFHLRDLADPALRAENMGCWMAHALFDTRTVRTDGLAEALERFARHGRRDDPGEDDARILARLAPR
jgi:GT2 family glycosyltransferase